LGLSLSAHGTKPVTHFTFYNPNLETSREHLYRLFFFLASYSTNIITILGASLTFTINHFRSRDSNLHHTPKDFIINAIVKHKTAAISVVSFAAVFWDGERCVTSQKTAAKETTITEAKKIILGILNSIFMQSFS